MSSSIEIEGGDQIGLVRSKCHENNVFSIQDIASCYQKIKTVQSKNGTWCYEIFSENGSDADGFMTNHATGETSNCIIWPVNHYLALNRHPYVIESAKHALDKYGAGCGTSAMSGGHNRLHKILEKKLAELLNKEDALLFSTGYSANVGAIAGLAKGAWNLVLIDRDAHASLFDGCKLAGCKYLPFKHNSIEDLKKKLDRYSHNYENVFIVVESVYSMTGNHAPLEDLVMLRNEYKCFLFVDEAHSFGLYGKKGAGRCSELNLSSKVDFIMTTLSKATGSIGGVIATDRKYKTLLQVEANSYLFQAALTPADTAAVIAALEIIEKGECQIEALWENTRYFRKQLTEYGFDIGEGISPIIPLFIRDSDKLMKMGKDMLDRGVFTTSVAYPVVHHKDVRFRFIVNASHTRDHIDQTLLIIEDLGKKYGLIQQASC